MNWATTTPRISDHARQRCAEMEISTKVAKRIVRNATLSRPGYHNNPDRRFVTSTVEPDYAVILDERAHVVITVLHYSPERRFIRGEA